MSLFYEALVINSSFMLNQLAPSPECKWTLVQVEAVEALIAKVRLLWGKRKCIKKTVIQSITFFIVFPNESEIQSFTSTFFSKMMTNCNNGNQQSKLFLNWLICQINSICSFGQLLDHPAPVSTCSIGSTHSSSYRVDLCHDNALFSFVPFFIVPDAKEHYRSQ